MKRSNGIWSLALGFLLLALLFAYRADAQSLNAKLSTVAKEIQSTNPKIGDAAIKEDIEVINASFKEINAKMTVTGLTTADAVEAAAAAWRDMRTGPAGNKPLTVESFAAYASDFGKISISSDPPEAFIYIDGWVANERTNTIQWIRPGQRKIKLTKPGCIPEEETRTIVRGSNDPFHKKLKETSEAKPASRSEKTPAEWPEKKPAE